MVLPVIPGENHAQILGLPNHVISKKILPKMPRLELSDTLDPYTQDLAFFRPFRQDFNQIPQPYRNPILLVSLTKTFRPQTVTHIWIHWPQVLIKRTVEICPEQNTILARVDIPLVSSISVIHRP